MALEFTEKNLPDISKNGTKIDQKIWKLAEKFNKYYFNFFLNDAKMQQQKYWYKNLQKKRKNF